MLTIDDMTQTEVSRQGQGVLVGVLLLAAIIAAGWARYNLHERVQDPAERFKEVLSLPPGEVLRKMVLGYHSLAADLLFIRANIYWGEHMTTDEQIPWISSFIDILMELDPDFKAVYFWGDLATIFYKREIDYVPKKLIERANQILETGMQRFPDDYRFPMRIGYNLHYELGEGLSAMPYFARAAMLPGAPEKIRNSLVALHTRKKEHEVAKEILKEMYMETQDTALGDVIRDSFNLLLTPEERKQLILYKKSLTNEWAACCKYLSFDTFLLVKEP